MYFLNIHCCLDFVLFVVVRMGFYNHPSPLSVVYPLSLCINKVFFFCKVIVYIIFYSIRCEILFYSFLFFLFFFSSSTSSCNLCWTYVIYCRFKRYRKVGHYTTSPLTPAHNTILKLPFPSTKQPLPCHSSFLFIKHNQHHLVETLQLHTLHQLHQSSNNQELPLKRASTFTLTQNPP